MINHGFTRKTSGVDNTEQEICIVEEVKKFSRITDFSYCNKSQTLFALGSRRGRTNQTSNDSSLDNSGPSDLSLTVTSNDAFSPPVQRTPSSVPYNHTKIMCSPYAGWKLYFPEEGCVFIKVFVF